MKLSVLIITYNHEKYIADCLNGILNQLVDFDYEVIIGDDCSKDNTRHIVKQFADKHPNIIKPILRDSNIGMNSNFVDCYEKCQGDYIAICEGDDYWIDNTKLQKQVDYLDINKEVAVTFHNVNVEYQDGTYPTHTFVSDNPVYPNNIKLNKERFTIDDLVVGNFIQTCSVVFRNKLINEFPSWFYELSAGDWLIHILNAKHGEIAYLNFVGATYRVHNQGVWASQSDFEKIRKTEYILSKINELFDYKYSESIARKVIELNTNLARLLLNEAYTLVNQSDFNNGLEKINVAEDVLSKSGNAIQGLLLLKAVCLANLGSLNDALDCVIFELIINPENDSAYELQVKIEKLIEEQRKNLHTSKQTENSNYVYEVTIVIPVFNNEKYTKNCLNAILDDKSNYISYEILLVDNASTDSTGELLEQYSKEYDKVRYLTNTTNLGFAKACNQAIVERLGRHVLLLNNDTLPHSGWLNGIMEEMISDETIGAVGACLLYPETDLIQHCGVKIGTEDGRTLAPYHPYRLSHLGDVNFALESQFVSAVTGACILIREEVITNIGLLDEEYINGLEDIDYCFRITKAGYKIKYSANCIVEHYESMTPTRHQHDVTNWQRLNKKWLNNIDFDETQAKTNLEVANIKERERVINLEKQNELEAINNSNEQLDFSIIIPVHNNLEFTKQCIDSIEKQNSKSTYEIIIINNASTDDTADWLNKFIGRFKVITNNENLSYSKINNQGAEFARGKYLLFLNNDTKVLPNFLDEIKNRFEENPDYGIQGCKLLYPNGMIQHAGIVYGFVNQNLKSHYHIYLTFDYNSPVVNLEREYQMVTGAALAVRKNLFDIIEGFDENYHFGHEDLDLCLKARSINYKVVYNPKAIAFHYESMTKKNRGIEQFERYFKNPTGFDSQNESYFQSKWANTLIMDADSYYEKDGYHGLSSNPQISVPFFEKVKELLSEINNLAKEENVELITEIAEILFKEAQDDVLKNPRQFAKININTINNLLESIRNIVYQSEDLSNLFHFSDRKKVLFTMYGWNDSGGGTTFPKSVAKSLSEQFEVAAFYAAGKHNHNFSPYYLEEYRDEEVTLFALYNRATSFLDADNPEREVRDDKAIKQFTFVLDKFKPDVIHFHNFLGLSFAMLDEAKKRNIPVIYTPHNYHLIDPNLYMYDNNLVKWEKPDFYLHSDLPTKNPSRDYKLRLDKAKEMLDTQLNLILAVSSRQKEIFEEFVGKELPNIKVVNQIPEIHYKKVRKVENELLEVGFIGGAMPHKGVHILIQAAQLLDSNACRIHIHGFISEQYKQMLINLKPNCRIEYHGEYSIEDLPRIASELDVIVIPSIWEDCAPLVVSEALSMGLPVVAAKIGGIPDFVKDGFNGSLYTYNSPIELATKLARLSFDKDALKELQLNTYLPYDFAYYVEFVSNIYKKMADNELLSEEEVNLRFLEKIESGTLTRHNLNTYVQKEINKDAQLQLHNEEQKLKKQEVTTMSEEQSIGMNRLQLSEDLQHGFSNKKATGKMPEVLPNPLRLNLGCGKDVREGFINIDLYSTDDKVVGMDIRKISLPNSCADYILASDVLEHFSHRETDSILKEWARLLKPGGILEIRCPSLKLQMKAYLRGDWNADIASYMIFGGQTNPGDYHCVAFDELTIKNHLTLAGLEVSDFQELDYPQEKGFINLNMVVKAQKLSLEGEVDILSTQNLLTPNAPNDNEIYGGGNDDFDYDYEEQVYEDLDNLPKVKKYEAPSNYHPQLNIVWEGSQLVYHSLALINREHSYNILKSGQANLTIIPYENDKINPVGNDKYEALFANDIRVKAETPKDVASLPYVWIRHQWPPKEEAPLGGKWIIMQPWEFTQLRADFVELFNDADEVWTPSNFCRNVYVDSGVNPDKVQIIPNGINPELFTPAGPKFKLRTKKKLKLLYVGGTIQRKGIDILLASYQRAFSVKDNICLVIKDLGGESFYRGQTAQQMIKSFQQSPEAPEVEYIDAKLSEEDMASLYRTCDVFVSSYRGEGFSLPTLEAMACGLPVVVTRGGATDDFVDEAIGWQIPSSRVSIGDFIDGKALTGEAYFLEPNEDTLTQILKEIYDNPSTLLPIGLLGSLRARTEWTWNRATLKALSRLDALYGTSMSKNGFENLRDNEDALIKLGKAEKLYIQHDVEAALLAFKDALDSGLSEERYVIYATSSIALILLEKEDYETATQVIKEGIAKYPNSIDLNYILVKCYTEQNDLENALETMTPVIDSWNENKYESNISLSLDHILSYTGDLLYNLGDNEGAIEIYNNSLKMNSENTEALYGLGLCFKDNGSIDEAINYLEKALYYDPMNDDVRIELNNLHSLKESNNV